MPERRTSLSREQVKEHRTELEKKYKVAARSKRVMVSLRQTVISLINCVFLVVGILIILRSSGLISINVSVDIFPDIDWFYSWLILLATAVFCGFAGLFWLAFVKGYRRPDIVGVTGERYRWEKYVREIRLLDPNQVGDPLTELLSLTMTARRVAVNSIYGSVVLGLFGLVSVVGILYALQSSDSSAYFPYVIGGTILVITTSIVLSITAHNVQWMFLPVPELVRQYLMLIYLQEFEHDFEKSHLLADDKLNETVNVCPECYFDQSGKIAVLGYHET